jgi:hypothetical protein
MATTENLSNGTEVESLISVGDRVTIQSPTHRVRLSAEQVDAIFAPATARVRARGTELGRKLRAANRMRRSNAYREAMEGLPPGTLTPKADE